MNHLNVGLSTLSESFTIAFADRVRRLKAEGVPVIGLQTGDPDFATPQPIITAAMEAIHRGETHYSNSRGLPALRQAIADRMQRLYSLDYDPEREVLVTHGAIHAYYAGLLSVVNPGEQVLVPDPSWQTHANMVRVVHGEPIRVPASAESGFFPTFDAWQQAVTPNTVALVINTPNNPTGSMVSRAYLKQLVDFAREHNLMIISDEVYDRLVYDDNKHVSAASVPGARERALVVNSMSKTYAMTGWRVGYLAGPAPVIDQALKASQHSITNLAPFIQWGAVTALTDPEVEQATQTMVDRYAQRRRAVLQIAGSYENTPVSFTAPQGAFYFFMDMRSLGIPSADASERLLEEANVAVVPGSNYGNAGEGFLRMTIAAADDDVKAGTRAILDWARVL